MENIIIKPIVTTSYGAGLFKLVDVIMSDFTNGLL